MFQTSFAVARDFRTDWLRNWCRLLHMPDRMHRKHWEMAFAAETLVTHDMLRQGRCGIGFGVGQEPTVKLFAERGTALLATDLLGEDWEGTHGHFAALAGITNVTTQVCDMNWIAPEMMQEQFDFTWSLCSMDHVGTIWLVKRFVLNSLNCVKPGGIAVHTGEYTLEPGMPRIGTTVWLNASDLIDLQNLLGRLGHKMAPIDWFFGDSYEDHVVDLEPWDDPTHLKSQAYNGWGTSVAVTVQKVKPGTFVVPLDEDEARQAIEARQ